MMTYGTALKTIAPLVLLAGSLSVTGCGSEDTAVTPGNTYIFYASTVFLNGSTARATGYNGFGQLGDGTTVNRTAPAAISQPGRFRGMQFGAYHSLAFGTYTTWTAGGNSFGQLGRTISSTLVQDVSFGPVIFTRFTSAANPRPGQIVTAAAGGTHNLLTDASGRVWAWGGGAYGQLGNNIAFQSADPVLVLKQQTLAPLSLGTADGPFDRALAAGGYHSLALTRDGKVYAWGSNGYGQLGASATTVPFLSVAAEVQGLPTIARIAAAGSYSLALDSLGYVWAWGNNGRGQVGLDPAAVPSQALPFRNFSGVQAIAAGLAHVVVLRRDGSVWTWGFNDFGQLGDGTKTDRFTPLQVSILSSKGMATAVMAFGNQSFARIGTTWYAWGDNGQGQLGVSTDPFPYVLTPLQITGM